MKKANYWINFIMMLTLFSGFRTVHAADAVRVFLELSDNTATIWPTQQGRQYLRGRAVFLDANNELATTFAGQPISDAQLDLESLSFGSDALFSTRPAHDLVLTDSDFEPAAETVSVSLAGAWQEFAVNYDNARRADNDIIAATLTLGNASVSGQSDVTVEAPVANCYVVRTGGIQTLPDVLDIIPDQQNDGGRTKRPGDTTTVDVFAAFYNEDAEKYYFTDRVPEDAKSFKVGSEETTLEDGYARLEVSDVGPSFLNQTEPEAPNNQFRDGDDETDFAAFPLNSYTRRLGELDADVTDDGELKVTTSSVLFGAGVQDEKIDFSTYKYSKAVNKITIVGLPINALDSNGDYVVSGFVDKAQVHGPDVEVSTYDALKLLDDPTIKPAPTFKVAGDESSYIYGAIVGYDEDGKLAPFSEGHQVTFFLKKEDGVDVTTPAELRALPPWAKDPEVLNNSITTISQYQAFLPFQIKAKAATADGSIASITNLYISDIQANGASLDRNLFATIDEKSEGIDFIVQDTIASIDLTGIDGLDGSQAGETAEVIIEGKGAEKSFELRVFKSTTGSVVTVDLEGSSNAEASSVTASSVVIPNDKDNIAKQDVAFLSGFDKIPAPLFFLFRGLDEGTNVIRHYKNPKDVDGNVNILAADPGDFDPSGISSKISLIKVTLDEEQNHDTVVLDNGPRIIIVKDYFKNTYEYLDDSNISGKVYLPEESDTDGSARDYLEDGNPAPAQEEILNFAVNESIEKSSTATASETEFPGTSVKINKDDDDNIDTVEIGFSLDEITDDRDVAVLKLTIGDGTESQEITLDLKVIKQVALNNIFVPVPGITDTPVDLFLADQGGSAVIPVANAVGIAVDLKADDGSIRDADAIETLDTVSPHTVFTVQPATGNTSMSITADTSKYGSSTLVLTFAPDFEPPVVGQITAENCAISIEIIDNQQVDLSATEVTVLDGRGADITDSLTRNESEDGTPSGTIILSDFPDGEDDYALAITAMDRWHNSNPVDRAVSVSCVSNASGGSGTINCLSVNPSNEMAGTTEMDITISFESGIVLNSDTVNANNISFECQGVTVLSAELILGADSSPDDSTTTTVNSSPDDSTTTTVNNSPEEGNIHEILATISISEAAPECTGDVTLNISGQATVCENAFTVDRTTPACLLTDIRPESAASGRFLPRFIFITISAENLSYNNSTAISFVDAGDGIVVLTESLSRNRSQINALILIMPTLDPAEYPVVVTTDGVPCSGVSLTIR